MSQTSPILSLPYLQASQAQKHVTHNEALRVLDAITQLSVLAADLTTPPGSPSEGDCYIPALSPTGDWAGHAGEIAVYADGAWQFFLARPGWRADVTPTGEVLRYNGTIWEPALTNLQNLPELGVNTTADTTNRLAVAADATLLNHDGDDHQLKINKAAAADTASLLFQTGFSGRTEMGTTGSDDFAIKVSADGSSWTQTLSIDGTTGHLGVGAGTPTAPLTVNTGAATNAQLDFGNTVATWEIKCNGATGRLTFGVTGGNTPFKFDSGAVENLFRIGVVASDVVDINGRLKLDSYTVATLPSATATGSVIFVSDETGGAVTAFSDGIN